MAGTRGDRGCLRERGLPAQSYWQKFERVVLWALRLKGIPVFKFLKALMSVGALNDDPAQKRLAQLFLTAAEQGAEQGWPDTQHLLAISSHAMDQGWSTKDAGNRFAHAVSMIKPIADSRVYAKAAEIGEFMYLNFRRY